MIDEFMTTSRMVWFKPTPALFNYFRQGSWKWRRFHDCGAGTGELTKAMLKNKLECVAYDLHPRNDSVAKVEAFNTADIADRMDLSEVALIARPCHHPEFIDATIRSALEIGEAFYIGLTKNFERDLDQFEYDVVAMDVGVNNEDLVRIRCAKDKAQIRRQIKNYNGNIEWWWFKPSRNRYTSEPDGLAGFGASDLDNIEVLKEERWASDLQLLETKATACSPDSLHGWVAPDGEWFGCDYAQHDYIARAVLGCSVKRLETLGFCRCHENSGKLYWRQDYDEKKRPTPKQKTTLKQRGFEV